jgi:hypothetical protein
VVSGSFQYVVDLSLLEALRPELLVALLKPYERALAGFGIIVDRSQYSSTWLGSLHSVLNRDDAKLPAPLQSALMDIADLSTVAGGELIIAEALRRGIELVAGVEAPQQDLAVQTYLAHPDLFRASHSRLQLSRRTTIADFYGAGATRPLPRQLERQLKTLKRRLQSAFLARRRSGFCRLLLDKPNGELVLIVAHGRLPQRGALIRSQRRREVRTYVIEAHDVIIYDHAMDRLSIDAKSPDDVDLYRAVMGYLVALDDDYFHPFPIYSADPFRERGAAALDVVGITNLEKVILRGVTLFARGRPELVQALASDDLRPWLDKAFRTGALEHLVFGSWAFGVVIPELRLPLEVELRPPNQISFDPRLPIGRFRRFLSAAGFEVVPGGRKPRTR